jgi:hypothetical protein
MKNKLVRKERIEITEVEISPSNFISYREYVTTWKPKHDSFAAVHVMDWEDEEFYQRKVVVMELELQDKKFTWAGFGTPISVRLHNNELYMIVLDSETDYTRMRFRFYHNKLGGFSEIPASDYPKQIAIQNLALKKTDGYEGDGKTPIRPTEITKKLDPNDIHFRRSLTAKIWYQLVTGTEYFEEKNSTIDKTFIEEYIKQHKTVKLNDIVRENRDKSTKNDKSERAK